jgi:hypothetical protein
LAYAGGAPHKGLIELEGRTFLERIVCALLGSERVRRVALVGLPPAHRADIGSDVAYLPDAGSLLENARAGQEHFRATGRLSERLLLSTCDVPLITPDTVRDLVERCLTLDADVCFPVVSQEVMERAYPGSGRTFAPLADGRFAAGGLAVARPDLGLVTPEGRERCRRVLEALVGRRKRAWKQARTFGLGTLFLFIIGRLTLAQAERRVSRVLGITGKVVISARAELAMDVDKPYHLDVVRDAARR